MSINHFEELWNECEKLFIDSDMVSLNNDFFMKVSFFKSLVENISNISEPDKEEYLKGIKKMYGEILFSLSQISAKLDINVFKSMMDVYNYNKIDSLEKKYK